MGINKDAKDKKQPNETDKRKALFAKINMK